MLPSETMDSVELEARDDASAMVARFADLAAVRYSIHILEENATPADGSPPDGCRRPRSGREDPLPAAPFRDSNSHRAAPGLRGVT